VPAGLNENERAIWQMLSADEATHVDTLLEESKLSFGDLSAALLGLEMREFIRTLPGKHYARKV
jgi:predicted Rossmann fold nucleotide-binding protein DprA/Smf involved in DNA uptake